MAKTREQILAELNAPATSTVGPLKEGFAAPEGDLPAAEMPKFTRDELLSELNKPPAEEPGILSRLWEAGKRANAVQVEAYGKGDPMGNPIGAIGAMFGGEGGQEAAERAAVQTATLGQGDEIKGLAGGIKAALQPASAGGPTTFGAGYEQARDADRAANEASVEAHPGVTLGTSLVTGAALPGPKGILGNAALGGAIGLGLSEAQDAAGLATDTALGGAAGGVLAAAAKGVGALAKKVFSKSPDKLRQEVLNEITEGSTGAKTTPTQANKLDKAGDAVMAEVTGRDGPAIREAWNESAAKGRAAIDRVLQPIYDRNNSNYAAFERSFVPVSAGPGRSAGLASRRALGPVSAATAGGPSAVIEMAPRSAVDPATYVGRLRVKAKELADAGSGDYRLVKLLAQDFEDLVSDRTKPNMDLKSLRAFTTTAQGKAAEVIGGLEQKAAVAAKGRLARYATEVMDDALDDAAKGNPDLEKVAANIRANNRRIYGLRTVDDALRLREYKENTAKGQIEKVVKAVASPSAGALAGGALGAGSDEDEKRLGYAAIGLTLGKGGAMAAKALQRASTSAALAGAAERSGVPGAVARLGSAPAAERLDELDLPALTKALAAAVRAKDKTGSAAATAAIARRKKAQ